MRDISCKDITEKVAAAVQTMATVVSPDVRRTIEAFRAEEPFQIAQETLDIILENQDIAKETNSPICQDTGMIVAFVTMGQEVHLVDGLLEDAISEGVGKGYTEGYLRKSVVSDPLVQRLNTKNNTPAITHVRLVPGDSFEIALMAKGFGSENMSQLKMLKPADGLQGVLDFVVKTAAEAGPNACPPIIVGVGVGGTMEKAASMAKHSLLRELGSTNPDPEYAEWEDILLERINALGIGPQGYGGRTFCLDVFMEHYATHIAGLPVAVNIQCHAARHAVLKF
jgi:fumarate hydratase subunit alpha